ncbi:separin protein, partial [Spiromyces aspiralis]
MDVYAGAETPLVVLDSCALPRTWVVVGVSIDPFVGSIFVTRYQGGRDPCVLRLPLASNDMPPPTNVTNEGTCEMSYAGVLAELRDIIEASDQSMRQGRECETREQKEEWWKNRKQLDDRLGDLLHRIEAAWLGDFKGILANTHIVSECALDEFRQELQHLLVAKWIPKSQVAKCKGLELDVTICQLLLNLSSLLDFASSDLLDACHCILDSYLYQNVALEYEQIDIQQMALDLRELIEKYSKQGHTNADEHIILIVDKYAQQLPWESIPCLRGRAVSRLPSVTFLADRLLAMRVKQQLGAAFRDAADTPPMFGSPSRRHCSTTGPLPASLMLGPADVDLPGLKRVHSQEEKDGEIDGVVVNLRRLYYILNPEGDLSRTQSTFEPFLTRR